MSLLVRATDLTKRPVVTLDGEDVAQIKDIIYDAGGGGVGGFTLNGRGLLAGPLKTALATTAIIAIGPDAVMIANTDALTARADIAEKSDVKTRNVLGDRVLTDSGTDLGTVVDVILQVDTVTDVVGYEIQATPALEPEGRKVLIPLPDALAISGEAVIVPHSAIEFVSHDLSGFGASVTAFRAHLEGNADAVQ